MSQSSLVIQEANRIAFIRDAAKNLKKMQIRRWLKENPEISADLLDLRTLVPLDTKAIFDSVKKTNRVIILHEATLFNGFGGELSALISENCFEYLDAPIKRVASIDTPVPFINQLEQQFMPNERFKEELISLVNY